MPTLRIKNMVCDRCIEVAGAVVEDCGLGLVSIKLGEAEVQAPPTDEQLACLRHRLKERGFELLEDSAAMLVEQIKVLVLDLLAKRQYMHPSQSIGQVVSERLGYSYAHLSRLFSQHMGSTLEKYIIRQRIERAKELLSYGEHTLSQIATELHYSSVQHLSRQFKDVAGMTPQQFKAQPAGRFPLDKV